jgi:hypothetical protein
MTNTTKNPLYSLTSPWDNYDPGVRLKDLREFCDAGVAPAIHDAWVIVINNKFVVPDWLAAATISLIAKVLPRGRVAYRRKMRHYYRWRTVRRLRSDDVEREDVFKDASDALLGTQYYAGRDAIEASYKKVQSGLKDPKTALQYYTAMKETRELIGTSFSLKK